MHKNDQHPLHAAHASELKNVNIDQNQGDNTLKASSIPLSHPQLPHMSSKLPYVHPTASDRYYSPPTTESHPFSQQEPTHVTEKRDFKHFQYEYTRSGLSSSLPGTSPKYLDPHNMHTQWATYEEAMRRKNDPKRSPGESWRIPSFKVYRTQRKHDVFNFSNSNICVIDALKYNNGPALLRLNGGEGDMRVQIFRQMEEASKNKDIEETFRLYGEFHGHFPNEPRSTYMGNMLLELCQGQHPSRVRFLMTQHFTWNVYRQEEEQMLAPQNLETFRLALAAFASTGFYQELEKYFQYSWRFFGQDLVAYHILLRNVMGAPDGIFMKWFKQLFQTNLGNGGSRNPRKIQPTLETWKMLMLYQGGTGNYKNAMNIYNHLKAFHMFKHGWERIEKELTYTYNTAVIQSRTLTRAKRRRYLPLLGDYYNAADASVLPRFPEDAETAILYPTYSFEVDDLIESNPLESNDLTKLNADKNMMFDIDFHLLHRDGFQENPYKVIKYFKKNIRWTTDPSEHHKTTIYANKILRALLKRDVSLGYQFLLMNYDLKRPDLIKNALRKQKYDAQWLMRYPRTAKYEARSKNVSKYWKARKNKLRTFLEAKEALIMAPNSTERKRLSQKGLTFAKIKPNEATYAMLLYQAYRVHRHLPKFRTEETAKEIAKQRKLVEKKIALAQSESERQELAVELDTVSFPVAMEGSPIVWAYLSDLGVQSVEGGRYTTLAGYFEKLYGVKPIPGVWFHGTQLDKDNKRTWKRSGDNVRTTSNKELYGKKIDDQKKRPLWIKKMMKKWA